MARCRRGRGPLLVDDSERLPRCAVDSEEMTGIDAVRRIELVLLAEHLVVARAVLRAHEVQGRAIPRIHHRVPAALTGLRLFLLSDPGPSDHEVVRQVLRL